MRVSSLHALAEIAREHLARGRVLRSRAVGQSMWPLVRDGALVEIHPLSEERARVGDVVLFESPRGLVLHRVVALRPGGVVTKGDAEPRGDGTIAGEALLGRLPRRPWDPAAAIVSRVGGRRLHSATALARALIGRFQRGR